MSNVQNQPEMTWEPAVSRAQLEDYIGRMRALAKADEKLARLIGELSAEGLAQPNANPLFPSAPGPALAPVPEPLSWVP